MWLRFLAAVAVTTAILSTGCDPYRCLVQSRTPYAGQVPFAELWELIQRQPVFFEVVFGTSVPPLRIGPLDQTGSSDWQDVCT